jgi:hypothetical protein
MFKSLNIPPIVPWFLYDLSNQQLITSPIVPSDITDSKSILYAEIQIPGLSGQPYQAGGLGNRKIAFTLQVIKRDDIIGNLAMLKQFEALRVPSFDFRNIVSKTTQFQSNPKVLYYWGTGSLPLVWYVTKCNFVHKQNWNNSFGVPKYSDVAIELTLDEFNPVNKAEDIYRQLLALTGNADNVISNAFQNVRRPY